jgi:Glycosyl transferases group 1
MTIAVVAGPVANKPWNGGNACVPYSYVSGLRHLGFDVFLVEQIEPATCVDSLERLVGFRASTNLAFFAEAARQLDQPDCAVLVCEHDSWGIERRPVPDLLAEADLLLNISGHLNAPLRELPRRTAFIDLDPGYTQFWHASGIEASRLQGHDAYFTVGTNIGQPECPIPTGDVQWIPTLPPTVLAEWSVGDPVEPGRFTTAASWRGPFGPVSHVGHSYGLKVHEFRKFVELPERAPGTFELALDIHPADGADRDLLLRHGWRVIDPASTVAGPLDFRRYVHGSSAEFSVAQGIYVDTCSGWFSDRTARYLASGRPAVVQDTGVGQTLPVGEGLLTFRTLDEAVERVHEVMENPERHRKAARALAEEHLDSDVVLGKLLEHVGVAP